MTGTDQLLYDIHNVALRVSAPKRLAAEFQVRLKRLRRSGAGPAGLEFSYGDDPERIALPPGRGRRVYDFDGADILYFEDMDLLFLSYGSGFRALCRPASGTLEAGLDGSVASTRLASQLFFTIPMIEMMKRRGFYSVHAAAFFLDGRGVLAAGPSGAGKSTVAVAMLRSGLPILGDDIVFLRQGREGLRALAFPQHIEITPGIAGLFPELDPYHYQSDAQTPGADGHYQADIVWQCRPSTLLLTGIGSEDDTTFQPIEADEALLELAPNVLLTDPVSSQAHLDALTGLARSCRCLRMKTGRNLDVLPYRLHSVAGGPAQAAGLCA